MEMKKSNEETSGTYETGVTQPGKSYRGLIAVLFMLVIFLSGVVTAMSLMNVQLFRQLNEDDANQAAPVSFEAPATDGISPYTRMDVGTQASELGIWYVPVSGVCNEYYDIPQGPMVTSAEGQAESAGIRAGDILRAIKGQPIDTEQDLRAVLETCQSGEQVEVTIYRVSEKKELKVTLAVTK